MKCSRIINRFQEVYSNSVKTIMDFTIEISFVNQKSELQHKETFKLFKTAGEYVRRHRGVAELLSIQTINVDEANNRLVQSITSYEVEASSKISNFLRLSDIRQLKETITIL